VIRKYFDSARVASVDRCSRAVRFCHRVRRAWFLQGDARHVAFAKSCFDVVTDVESSHTYPSSATSIAKVFCILRLGGYLLYADFLCFTTVLQPLDEVAWRRYEGFDCRDDVTLTVEFLLSPKSSIYREMQV